MVARQSREDAVKALCYQGPRRIEYGTTADPLLADDRDALVKMEACAICGSDLHIYHGSPFSQDTGYCVGHEAIGEIVETGKGVRRFKVGDKVMLSAAVGCGQCHNCLAGDIARCLSGGAQCYGLSAALQGCQAEAIRVPKADFNAAPIPDGLTPDQALMLTDNLPTAYLGCRNADIGPGKTVTVIGLGPIGLMAVEIAYVLGASAVFAIDLVPGRREQAKALGAIALDPKDAVQAIGEATKGQMSDCVVEAVGSDPTIQLGLTLAGRGGTVSAIGVNTNMDFRFPMGLAFAKSLTFRIALCSVQMYWPELIPLIRGGRLHPEKFISHRLSLSEGAHAYELTDKKTDGALKMVMTP
jgi:2-desacetyl-2-hydroxyethyl bacteriochlorophyllide A dehydrogenase